MKIWHSPAVKYLAAFFILTAFLWAAKIPPAYAQNVSAEERGLSIATEARENDRGFGNYTADQVMVLRNKQGQESKRQLRIRVLEVPDDGNKVLFVFDEPRDVKGTAFLIHAHQQKADDQWLYLPALKRVKRISSSNRSGSFMGSEFAYEDMTPQEVEKFTYQFLREEPCEDLNCTVTERIPVDKKSGYRRQIIWRDTTELLARKIEFYDRKDAHFKTLILNGYQQYLDRYWRASELTMQNHLSGKSTVLSLENFVFQADLNEKDFTKTGLKRIR